MEYEAIRATEPDAAPATARWSDLFAPHTRGPVIVLASGIALYAINVYVTASLLPNAVADIGGEELYAWAMTSFLLASVISSMFVGQLSAGLDARLGYLLAFAGFGAGLVIDAVAPTMPVFLAGRIVQGAAGGLLTGLAYTVLRRVLPAHLWTRAIALLSAMWGVGNVIGPVLGGLFAQLGVWRGAFWTLIAATAAAAVLAARVMPASGRGAGGAGGVPKLSLLLLTLATAALSGAQLTTGLLPVAVLGLAAALALTGFVARDRASSPRSLLPGLTYLPRSPLRWIYLVIAAVAIGSTIEAFVPLFGQRLGALSPLPAGLLGAAISWGWSAAGIATSGVTSARGLARLRIGGPALLAAGFCAYALTQRADPGPVIVAAWFGTLFIAGCGIGMTFGHSAAAVLRSTDDDAEAQKASAGVNTVQLVANTLGSALAGVLVSLGGPSLVGSAVTVSVGFAVIAALGAVCSALALRGERSTGALG
ncbi:MFS transporter [Naumannella huperziae]